MGELPFQQAADIVRTKATSAAVTWTPADLESTLDLRPGEMVEVRSAGEILASLDEHGALDALPFMPEMLQFCGKRFRVHRRADKTCNTINGWGGRRMQRTVHLADLRCDGQGHGGCQAGCLVFWKEAWLKRVPDGQAGVPLVQLERSPAAAASRSTDSPERERLQRAACATDADGERFTCQATELLRASSHLAWWDVRQFVRDIRTGDVTPAQMLRVAVLAQRDWLQRRLIKIAYTAFAPAGGVRRRLRRLTGAPGPSTITPSEPLDLQPGDLVRVRPVKEILATLDRASRNRGLYYDIEMWRFSGGTYRVLRKVEQIIDERTGRMRKLLGGCVILEGVVCSGERSARRRFCPRSIYSYWRQIWLRRVA